ncbi:MAG: AraC family transcriptional regulator [Conexibacter sp.]|nr:AraC family transcriptional regulator [Conexibacter sp.]
MNAGARDHAIDVAPSYREFAPPPGLEPFVACLWTSHDGEVRVLPDACVDIVLSAGRLVVAGPATTASIAVATPGQRRIGLRFRVGSAGAALGLPAAELLDSGVELIDVWGRAARKLEERVAAAPTTVTAIAQLAHGIADRLPPPDAADHEVRRAAAVVTQGGGTAAARRAAHLSERQLRRRFDHAVGYGPATLARVQRFQRFLVHAQRTPAAPLARLAADAGYADQAHLARECRRLAGLPPGALLAAGAAPAGERAEAFKPAGDRSAILAA